jgi:acetylornithine aminotransferase
MLICDEIQAGYGRSGKFFSHQWSGVKADIITLAKGIANGFPVGAVMISPAIPAKKGMLGTTFGGSHLACAAAIAVADVVKAEDLVENARVMGEKIVEGIKGTSGIKEIRGSGLMIGVDLSVPQADFRRVLREKYHIMTGLSGQYTLRLLPPLVIGEREVERFVEAFCATAAEMGM